MIYPFMKNSHLYENIFPLTVKYFYKNSLLKYFPYFNLSCDVKIRLYVSNAFMLEMEI